MMKHITLLVALSTTVLLAGCDLYFGGHDHDHWNYCGSDGYHECNGNDCEWVSATCPADSGGSGSAGGYTCTSNADCAAGCYCQNGTCEEAGFCTTDSDCGTGYVCNVDRSSCEPAPTGCSTSNDCPNGTICNNGACSPTCSCTTDNEAKQQGYDYCDEWRATCMSGSDPAGTCGGEPTCNQYPPTCAPGDVPLLGADGCWNGQCEAATQCAVPPSCSHINDSTNCLARADCSAVYTGLNCTKPDGSACNDGDLNCTCAQFVFASCKTRMAARGVMVKDQYGNMIDASQLLLN